jgi:hypothetical protein
MIKKFKDYFESISGTELINVGGSVGPGYGEEQMPVTLNKSDTEVVYSDITSEFYSKDDYDELYNQYLKDGGEILYGFNRENLDKILYSLSKNESSSSMREPKRITREEFNDKVISHGEENLSSNEKNLFKSVLDKKDISYHIGENKVSIRTQYLHCLIRKLGDYWFVIDFTGKWDRKEYYICDEYEESIRFVAKRFKNNKKSSF